jgi:hypothetical protein
MRRSILLLIVVIVGTLVIVLPIHAPDDQPVATPELTIEPEYTAEPEPTATHVPVTPPPYALSEAELVAIAKEGAIFNGLETFDGPPLVAWMTRENWENRIGLISHGHSERATVFVVAFHGTGEGIGFGGFANRFGEAPIKLDGFTVALHPQNGFPHTMISGFRAPPFATEYADWAEIE